MKTEVSNKITYSTVNSVKACVFWIIKQSCGETSWMEEGRDDFSLLSSKQGALLSISRKEDRVNLPFNAAVLFLIRGLHLSGQC